MPTTTLPASVSVLIDALGEAGATRRVEWTSTVKPAAAHKNVVLEKVVSATVRSGIEYRDLPENEGIDTGALPWGEWVLYPYLITHKGQNYIRLYIVDGTVTVDEYRADGEIVGPETFKNYLTPSAQKAKRSVGGTISVKVDTLRVV